MIYGIVRFTMQTQWTYDIMSRKKNMQIPY